MLYIFSLIIKEFKEPYYDNRKEFSTKSDQEEIFYALTEESPNDFREESLVTVKVFAIDEKQIKLKTDNDVIGVASGNDVFDNGEYNEDEAMKRY